MMTLFWFLTSPIFWFIAGFVACIAAARYNESDDLFWKLFISFVGAFTAGTVVRTALENDQEQKIVVVESAPTQVLESMPGVAAFRLADISLSATRGEKSPKPVSKDSSLNENDSLLSEVLSSARGQPQMCMYFDDS